MTAEKKKERNYQIQNLTDLLSSEVDLLANYVLQTQRSIVIIETSPEFDVIADQVIEKLRLSRIAIKDALEKISALAELYRNSIDSSLA